MTAYELKNISILNVKRVGISRDKAANRLLNNSVLEERGIL